MMKAPVLLMLGILLVGCSYFVSWDDLAESWYGNSIQEIIEANGEPESIRKLENGLFEYRYHLKKLDPSCVTFWIVNKEQIIVGHRYKGRCRPI